MRAVNSIPAIYLAKIKRLTMSPSWLRYLPYALRSKIAHRTNLLEIASNIAWLISDKILRMSIGLFVGIWVARHLGPENFGVLSYAGAIVALFTAISTLGLNSIVVRDLVTNPSEADETLGTAFVLQILGGFIAFIASLTTVAYIRPDEGALKIIVAIFGFALVLKATDVVRYWYESRVQSKYVVWIDNAAFIAVAITKMILIISGADLITFAYAALLEAGIVASLLLFIYSSHHGHFLSQWKFQYKRAKTLLLDSWPLISSGLATMLYMRIDQIMLGQILGNEAVGIYTAALRLSEIWYFVPVTIAASIFPSILRARNQSFALYNDYIKNTLELMMLLALALAVPVSFLSDYIILWLYGSKFDGSAEVLLIHIWTGLFVFSGVVGGRWFIAENLQKYTLYRTLAGCVVNILLNFLLIPKYGPVGSAWASVVSQATASFLFNALSEKTRPIFFMQLKAMGLSRTRNRIISLARS